MSDTYSAHRHREWDERGLARYEDFSEMTTDVNQEERGGGDYTIGEWFYSPKEPTDPGWIDGCRVIYSGTWGNDNSPGASHYTQAEVYELPDEQAAFEEALADWESQPEWAETDDDWESEDVDEDFDPEEWEEEEEDDEDEWDDDEDEWDE